MVLRSLHQPITLINTDDFIFNNLRYLDKTSEYFENLPWDKYLLRQYKIEFLKKHTRKKISDLFWLKFYMGEANHRTIDDILKDIGLENRLLFEKIKPTRRRAISEFNLTHNGNWKVERIPARSFGQKYAKIASSKRVDYRLAQRKFSELENEKIDDELIFILRFVASKLHARDKMIKNINIVVHHTQVVCYPNTTATNSPEGVHQDGMDYIVSALVVNRKNISGGTSVVYGSDKKTKIFEVQLKPGQGILQPDHNSDLWHSVTPIVSCDTEETGHRSTIGLDITVK